ncbi:MAG: hypothetical protein KatS3mg038_2967 [Candidatus Kapaibacterium sp.]|nr:MAG: hypothetical protein KatS3mg038_0805 [Candidatus Kapabacteria bacterium]GIV51357.1 MAG: hypothetical protein KatS3mg038_1878 [Candidatus Kapabacteria bacterium]GIV51447.1 MAG: hypothetical protein KatS3mg038_1968 [Candidatus Kapabacteria bacterium]GIV52446.1 MAG: hypothetical protein KatS3mg038_2967 [Candidatus Kapabacteria bacterium]
MADYYELVIYHVPTAQPRPRRGKHGAMYVPSNHPVHTFRSLIAAEFRRSHYPLLDGPIELRVSAYFPRPKRLLSKRAAPGRLPFVARKCDWDNLGKAVSDALTHYAWRDDGQIVRAIVERYYCALDEPPHVRISWRDLNADT